MESFVNSWLLSIPWSHRKNGKGRWELHEFLRLVDFATNIYRWILSRAMNFNGFQDIFIIKPEQKHITLLPSSCSTLPEGLQKVHFKVWWMVQKVWSRLEWEFFHLHSIFELRLTQFVMVSLFLKKKVGSLVHKAAELNSL